MNLKNINQNQMKLLLIIIQLKTQIQNIIKLIKKKQINYPQIITSLLKNKKKKFYKIKMRSNNNKYKTKK